MSDARYLYLLAMILVAPRLSHGTSTAMALLLAVAAGLCWLSERWRK